MPVEFEMTEIEIKFLYSRDCPSHEEALERLRGVLAEERVEAKIKMVEVKTAEQAKELKFAGSPTILIKGQDIDPESNPHYAVTCRAYRLEDGRISPLPSIAMIRKAIRSASATRD